MRNPEKVREWLSTYVAEAEEVHQRVRRHQASVTSQNASAGIFGSGPGDDEAFEQLPSDVRVKVLELEPSVVRILGAVDADLVAQFRATGNYRRRADLVRRAIAAVETLDEVDRWLGPIAPTPDPRGLHSIVAGAATVYWDAGQYRISVDETARAVNVHLQTALGRRNVDNADLARQAFSTTAPSPDQPRLRFPDIDKAADERTWKSRHQGAMEFAAGLFQAVRNITAHADPSSDELAPEYALDCLACFSLLVRWIDEAERRDQGD